MLYKDRIEKEKLEVIKKLFDDAFLKLKKANLDDISKKSDVNYITTKEGHKQIVIPYLNREILVDMNNKNIYWSDNMEKIDLRLSVITIHYLLGCTSREIGEGWISYREIPDALFYAKTIPGTLSPLVKIFSEEPNRLLLTAKKLNGENISIGDMGILLKPFPKYPVLFVFYKADEEFPTKVNVLYDKSVKNLLLAAEVKVLTIFLIKELINVKI